eukprot:gene4583-14768_t
MVAKLQNMTGSFTDASAEEDTLDQIRYLSKISFHEITTRKAGTIFGFPCPKGRGKESVEVCRGKIQQYVTLRGMLKSQVKRAKNIEKAQRQVIRAPKRNHQHHAAEQATLPAKNTPVLQRQESLSKAHVVTPAHSYKEITSKAGVQAAAPTTRLGKEAPKLVLHPKSLDQAKDRPGLLTATPQDQASVRSTTLHTQEVPALAKACSRDYGMASKTVSDQMSNNGATECKQPDAQPQCPSSATNHPGGCNSDVFKRSAGTPTHSPMHAALQIQLRAAVQLEDINVSTDSDGLPCSLSGTPRATKDDAPSNAETVTNQAINYSMIALHPASPGGHPSLHYMDSYALVSLHSTDACGSEAKATAPDDSKCFPLEDIAVPASFFLSQALSLE